jgi:hypothetical protein
MRPGADKRCQKDTFSVLGIIEYRKCEAHPVDCLVKQLFLVIDLAKILDGIEVPECSLHRHIVRCRAAASRFTANSINTWLGIISSTSRRIATHLPLPKLLSSTPKLPATQIPSSCPPCSSSFFLLFPAPLSFTNIPSSRNPRTSRSVSSSLRVSSLSEVKEDQKEADGRDWRGVN